MEDIKKKFTDWLERKEYFKKTDYNKKRAYSLSKKKDEIESIKIKMSETIY